MVEGRASPGGVDPAVWKNASRSLLMPLISTGRSPLARARDRQVVPSTIQPAVRAAV